MVRMPACLICDIFILYLVAMFYSLWNTTNKIYEALIYLQFIVLYIL